ncbi:unnamed protein product [Durusdinium trenchii]|uniref:EF-hand domain-containing protein n=1 Tax=Durusdinium trenchii TaxID=1381693 RepID=A0ABP0I0Z3_9DINO
MTTLFRSILGGLDWQVPADLLVEVGEGWMQLFHVFIGMAMLALLNVMIAVFCNSTIRAADLNHEVMMENRTSLRAKAAKLFRRMDESGFGCLTITEFEKAFDDEMPALERDRCFSPAVSEWFVVQLCPVFCFQTDMVLIIDQAHSAAAS